jgi:16S rRNA pseudouridine516 synthase
MFAAVGNHVTALRRDRIGGLALPDDLDAGHWRVLEASDVASLFSPA